MSSAVDIAFSFAMGSVLGILFFGGLWVTVHAIPKVRAPVLLSLGSLLTRTGITVLTLYFLARGGHWSRVIPFVIGFILVKVISIALSKKHTGNVAEGKVQ